MITATKRAMLAADGKTVVAENDVNAASLFAALGSGKTDAQLARVTGWEPFFGAEKAVVSNPVKARVEPLPEPVAHVKPPAIKGRKNQY